MKTEFPSIALLILAIIFFSFVAWFAYIREAPGEHKWVGGSGPDTVCVYETKYQPSTKMWREHTVCRDKGAK